MKRTRTAGRRPGVIGRHRLSGEIVGRLVRRHSTAAVLFHQGVAEHLGLGPADHKCLDLLRERGTMTATDLAAITGLTSGAVTGVVARLEESGYLRREPDPHDGRRQTLFPSTEREREIQDVFGPIRGDLTALLDTFDAHQLTGIAGFLAAATDLAYRHLALLRAPSLRRPRSAQKTAKKSQP